jgi:hypothetical protein
MADKAKRTEVSKMQERQKQLRWTKRDFEFVANLLANSLKAAKGKDERDGVLIVAALFTFALNKTNPLYDTQRFLDAVGVSFSEVTDIYERRNLREALR